MLLSVDDVLVNRGVKGFLHLAGGAGKFQHRAALRRAHLEAVRLQPGSDGLDIAVSRSELLAEFGRASTICDSWARLCPAGRRAASERGFLLRAALQHQEHTLHGERCRSCAEIELRTRQGMCVAVEHGQL